VADSISEQSQGAYFARQVDPGLIDRPQTETAARRENSRSSRPAGAGPRVAACIFDAAMPFGAEAP
jgi:hypothetical protein